MALRRVLIANRGEIAVRVIKACFDEGIESVLAVSQADAGSLGAQLADQVVVIGPAAAAESYLDVNRVVSAAKVTGCDALHPGYGFLSERPELAAACEEEGVIFIGPSAAAMRRSGDKATARALAKELDVPINEGSDVIETEADARAVAGEIGYPVLLKAAAGGGGRGMRMVEAEDGMASAFAQAHGEAEAAFGDGRLFLERYVRSARHVEVQVLGDARGRRRPPRHPRLHPAAPLPEADRGGARAGPLRRPPQRDPGRRRAPDRRPRLHRRRHLRVPRRPRPRLRRLPRDQRPAAGRAPGLGDRHRRRRGAGDAADRRRRGPLGHPGGDRDHRPRDRGADQRRVAGARLRPDPRHARASGRRRRAPTCASTPPASPAGRSPRTTTRCWRS